MQVFRVPLVPLLPGALAASAAFEPKLHRRIKAVCTVLQAPRDWERGLATVVHGGRLTRIDVDLLVGLVAAP